MGKHIYLIKYIVWYTSILFALQANCFNIHNSILTMLINYFIIIPLRYFVPFRFILNLFECNPAIIRYMKCHYIYFTLQTQMNFNEINYKEIASKRKLIKMVQITRNNKVDFNEEELRSYRALEHSLRSRDDIFIKTWKYEMRMNGRSVIPRFFL